MDLGAHLRLVDLGVTRTQFGTWVTTPNERHGSGSRPWRPTIGRCRYRRRQRWPCAPAWHAAGHSVGI